MITYDNCGTINIHQEIFWHLIAIKMLVSKVRAPELAKHNIFQSLEIATLGKGSLANCRSKEKDYKTLIQFHTGIRSA